MHPGMQDGKGSGVWKVLGPSMAGGFGQGYLFKIIDKHFDFPVRDMIR